MRLESFGTRSKVSALSISNMVSVNTALKEENLLLLRQVDSLKQKVIRLEESQFYNTEKRVVSLTKQLAESDNCLQNAIDQLR